jgi:hypothetical protein
VCVERTCIVRHLYFSIRDAVTRRMGDAERKKAVFTPCLRVLVSPCQTVFLNPRISNPESRIQNPDPLPYGCENINMTVGGQVFQNDRMCL